MMKSLIAVAGAGLLAAACTSTGTVERNAAGGAALGVVVFIFVLLLVTDIHGYTNVFPFVKKTVR